MSKSVISMDNLDWAIQLGCLPSACPDTVKEILNRGINSYIWDEISSKIYPVNEVIETRKNILLHYLKNKVSVSSIQHMRNTKRLKAERRIVASNIDNKEKECTKVDLSLRTNGLKLAKVQSQRKIVQMKKNILELKCQETSAGMIDFEEMFSLCQNLLPSVKTDIDEKIMNESLILVGAITSRAEKREALKQLSENLGSVAISQLWSWIMNRRIRDTEKLVNREFQSELLKITKQEHGERLNIGIARACGEHVICTTSKLVHLKKGEEERTRGINYIENIENSISGHKNETVQDWLAVTVEVAQLERNYKVIQSEIDMIKTITEEAENLRSRHLQLASEIHEIDVHMEQCANKVQQALTKFEPAGQSLTILKNQLTMALNMVAALNSESNLEWLNNHLNPEIEIFHENLNINALNKILLGGKVGAYRHSSTCMSNAVITSPAFALSTPVYQAPLYHLINCFQNITANDVWKSLKEEPDTTIHVETNLSDICVPSIRENDTLELLFGINLACEKCLKEIKNFDSIYDSWVYQFVNEVMALNEDTVHGASYDEWVQRYSTLAYMIHRNK